LNVSIIIVIIIIQYTNKAAHISCLHTKQNKHIVQTTKKTSNVYSITEYFTLPSC